jgi:hypothetical protein
MSVLKRADEATLHRQLLGYANRRTGQLICLEHGQRDIDSPHSPWVGVRLHDRVQTRDPSTTAVICHECGVWLNDESTGYAIVATDHDHWKRRLRRSRGHRDR